MLRIWLLVLLLTGLYYGNQLYGETLFPSADGLAPAQEWLNR